MMRLTGTRACTTAAAPTPPRLTTGRRAGSLIGALADPQVRLGAGAVALLVTALAVRRDRVIPGDQRPARRLAPARLGNHATGHPRCRPGGSRRGVAGRRP